jgi:prepilin-type N-terminal cleavage/methylation domain-containing protein
MMFRRLIHKYSFFNQKGFGLIELLIAVLISGIVGASIVSATISMANANDRNIARTMAVKEVETAVHYINRDVQQAQSVKFDGTDYWLKLTWTSWDDNAQNEVIYTVANEVLTRKYTIGSEDPVYIQVSRNIKSQSVVKPNPTPTPTTLPSEKTWTITITSEVVSGNKTATETREIKIIPRTTS